MKLLNCSTEIVIVYHHNFLVAQLNSVGSYMSATTLVISLLKIVIILINLLEFIHLNLFRDQIQSMGIFVYLFEA